MPRHLSIRKEQLRRNRRSSSHFFSRINKLRFKTLEKWHKFWLVVATFLFILSISFYAIPGALESALEKESPSKTSKSADAFERVKLREAWEPSVFGRLVSGWALEVEKGVSKTNDVRVSNNWLSRENSSSGDLDSGLNGPNPLQLAVGIKIYIYELPSKFNQDWLVNARCSNQLFAAEVAIHRILITSPLRTLDPHKADYFFLPVYVSCNFSPKTGFPSLTHARTTLQTAVNLVASEMPYWNRSEGRDHIFVATHDYGACFHSLEDLAIAAGIPKFMRNSIILQTFGKKNRHPCQKAENIQIPPYISPSAAAPYLLPPEQQRRDIWAYFRGKMEIHPTNRSGRIYSRGVRSIIWHRYARNKRFYLKRHRSEAYQSEILRSISVSAPLDGLHGVPA